MRSSPGYGSSTPPLKKYVTWAYFSVSASRRFVDAGPGPDVGEDVRELLRREGDGQAEVLLVLGEADEVDPRAARAAGSRRRRSPSARA